MEHTLPSRTLVLCFDGTSDVYDGTNTNVVKLFSALKKDDKGQQLVYYQTGIGTYTPPGIGPGFQSWLAKGIDKATAWCIGSHIKGGYRFLQQNYRAGDKICLFGFARGAYTVRALAGMLYKVGLLPRDNQEQVRFAYKIYAEAWKGNTTCAEGFKKTFCRSVEIDFMGCWDTVSSVGLFWGRNLPFTSENPIIKCFRHALSLDERRARFQPNFWRLGDHPASLKSEDAQPEFSNTTDVLEVWFAGGHDDVGGGVLRSEDVRSLSNISLRWMIREVMKSDSGVQFDDVALERIGISLSTLLHKDGVSAESSSPAVAEEDLLDATQPLHDALRFRPMWWMLEIVPFLVTWQDEKGAWHRGFRWNFGRGRAINAATPKVHKTVQVRMEHGDIKYAPRAKGADYANTTWVA